MVRHPSATGLIRSILVAMLVFWLGVACTTETPLAEPTSTPAMTPTDTPEPTDTATPTWTPSPTPTNTPTATATAAPTQTPTSTATPTETPTPVPPTNTPIPQVVEPTVVIRTGTEDLVAHLREVRVAAGGMADLLNGAMGSGWLECDDWIAKSDFVMNGVHVDVSNYGIEVQNAYNGEYMRGYEHWYAGTKDLTEHCTKINNGEDANPYLSRLTYMMALQFSSEAANIMEGALRYIEALP